MYTHAEKVFEGMSNEVCEAFKNASMEAGITFEQFCFFLGRDAGKMRENIEEKSRQKTFVARRKIQKP
jgi:hypothetical protein